jgi:E3 ubiquitin-protein ligase SHPRH
LALHAPSLKVFVYEGWSKLKVPITEYDVEIERHRRRSGGRSKSTASSIKSGRGKRKAKGKKGKAKYADSDDDDDDDYMDVDKPMLSVTSTSGDDGEGILDWCSYINTFDVCITTYSTLRQDLSVARAPPARPRREDVVYSNVERARSPLVMCEWYRVVMDEVQMVGGGKTE